MLARFAECAIDVSVDVLEPDASLRLVVQVEAAEDVGEVVGREVPADWS